MTCMLQQKYLTHLLTFAHILASAQLKQGVDLCCCFFFLFALATACPLTLHFCVSVCACVLACVCVSVCVAQHRNLSMFPLSAGGGPQQGQGAGQQRHRPGLQLGVPQQRGGHRRSSGGGHSRNAANEARQLRSARRAGLVHSGLQLSNPPLRPAAPRCEPRAGRAKQAEPGGRPHPVGLGHPRVSELHDQVRAPAARLSIISGGVY